jgi:hypothetical protein
MPNYGTMPITGTGTGVSATVLGSGDTMVLFSAESPTAPQASLAIAPGVAGGESPAITFQASWSVAPTASLLIQGAMADTSAGWAAASTLATLTTSPATYTDTGAWAYYRAYLSSQSAGGALTVIARAK